MAQDGDRNALAGLAHAADDLSILGAESETERRVKRVLPWVVSLLIHAGLIVMGFIVTWTVVVLQQENEPAMIVADFDRVMYEPLAQMPEETAELAEMLVQDRVELDLLEEIPDRMPDAAPLEIDPLLLISNAASASQSARFAPVPASPKASFVGLSSSNARRVVYVIDASGSMIRALPIVIEELGRSLEGLSVEQRFSVIFFSRNEAITVDPQSRLIVATPDERARVLGWIRERVIPAGRSNPVAAIEKALSFGPDVIFLLSENITGSGAFEIDQTDLLELLDRLNPVNPRTGQRRTRINCVQFLDPDPLDTLRRIAEMHGGPTGYKFLDRAELGLGQ